MVLMSRISLLLAALPMMREADDEIRTLVGLVFVLRVCVDPRVSQVTNGD